MTTIIATKDQVPGHTVTEIFDGRGSRPLDVPTVYKQMGMWERAALGLHNAVSDPDDGYIKFQMSARSRWLWVRLNGGDLYDMRITRYSSKDMCHFKEWSLDDVFAYSLPEVLTSLRDRY